MSALYFWRSWPAKQRYLWYLFAAISLTTLVAAWIMYYRGADNIIEWERLQEQKTIETTVHQFRLGPFQLSVPAESYVIFEYLNGGHIRHNQPASYLFLIILGLCLSLLVALVSTFERFWYFAGMSLFIVVMVSLQLEVLIPFGKHGAIIPMGILALYVALSFYFRFVARTSGLLIRFLSFTALTTVVAILLGAFAGAQFPILHLAATAYPAALIISLLFVMMIAHEIPAAFIYITSHEGTAGARHFLLLSFFYLAYVIISALHETGAIQWNFIYLDPLLLLTISTALGIWGFAIREPLYGDIFPFNPTGALIYLGLASLSFATFFQLAGNANDAALRVVRDIILFAHAGFGIIFVMYVLSNFVGMMSKGIRVYPLLYRPNRMPYFTFRLAGLIATLAFVFATGWREYVYYGTAGFYNYAADLYMLQDNERFAESFYEQTRARALLNNRANYELGKLRTERFDLEQAAYSYELANDRRPTEYSLVNEANLNLMLRRYFDAISQYRAASIRLSGSPAIANNLGYCYARIHALDSASHYLNLARESGLTKDASEMNFFAMAAAEYIPINTDSVLNFFDSESLGTLANAVALSNLFDQKLTATRDPLPSGELDLYSATYLNNYITKNSRALDTVFLDKAFAVAHDSVNFPFREALEASIATGYYQHGQVHKAMRILGDLTYLTQNYRGRFNYILGLWALEQGDPVLAAKYFAFAETSDYKEGKFYRAIALTESGQNAEAAASWDSLLLSDDPAIARLAGQMKKIQSLRPSEAIDLPDGEKYQFCRYRLGVRDSVILSSFIESFGDDNYKAQTLLDIAIKMKRLDLIPQARKYLASIAGLRVTDERLYENIRYTSLRILAAEQNVSTLRERLAKGERFDLGHRLDSVLYTSLIAQADGQMEKARKGFALLSTANPFFEEGVLAASAYFSENGDAARAYHVLTEAIYVNTESIRLLKAYAVEAFRQGFDEYGLSALERAAEAEAQMR